MCIYTVIETGINTQRDRESIRTNDGQIQRQRELHRHPLWMVDPSQRQTETQREMYIRQSQSQRHTERQRELQRHHAWMIDRVGERQRDTDSYIDITLKSQDSSESLSFVNPLPPFFTRLPPTRSSSSHLFLRLLLFFHFFLLLFSILFLVLSTHVFY